MRTARDLTSNPDSRMVNMPEVNIQVESISGEKFMKSDQPAPGQVQISTNVNILDLERKDDLLKVPFVVTIGYQPSVAQINMKGEAIVKGESSELEEIEERYKDKEQPPQSLVQNIINRSIMEATLISRSLNIPPPIPFPEAGPQNEGKGHGDRDYVG